LQLEYLQLDHLGVDDMDQNEQLMQLLMMMNPEMAQMMQLLNGMNNQGEKISSNSKKKKRSTAYQRRYKAAFKKISKKYKLKSGKWKKNGFRLAVKEAHRLARRGGKK
jgi:hypothetical protein